MEENVAGEHAPWSEYSVLVVDDEPGMLSFLQRALSSRCGVVDCAASVEAARPLRASNPALQGAVFIDAGHAEASWNGFNPVLGYGVGLRWRSPVGALRLDLAYGQRDRRLRLHFSLGITY